MPKLLLCFMTIDTSDNHDFLQFFSNKSRLDNHITKLWVQCFIHVSRPKRKVCVFVFVDVSERGIMLETFDDTCGEFFLMR